MIRALIFDCFGVIRPDRLALAYRQKGGDYEADCEFVEQTQRAANMGVIPGSRYIFAERLGITVDEWMTALDYGAELDTDLLDYVANKRQQYKTAILSNASKGRLNDIVGAANLQRCFDVTVESGSVGFAKPDVEIFEYTAGQLGVRFDGCIFTDDNQDYCRAAQTCGMRAIHYRSFDQYVAELEALVSAESRA